MSLKINYFKSDVITATNVSCFSYQMPSSMKSANPCGVLGNFFNKGERIFLALSTTLKHHSKLSWFISETRIYTKLLPNP